ncbi:hypothetical protein AB5I41_31575 [Sphingomonas sp. MMS24-JH45]
MYGLSPHNYTPETTNDQERWWKAESTAALQEVLLCENTPGSTLTTTASPQRVKVFRVENDVLVLGGRRTGD